MTPTSTSLGNHYNQDLQSAPKCYLKSEESRTAVNNNTGSGRSNSISHCIPNMVWYSVICDLGAFMKYLVCCKTHCKMTRVLPEHFDFSYLERLMYLSRSLKKNLDTLTIYT